jgi:uncharacterized Ntn-hydrolase superfamily protein
VKIVATFSIVAYDPKTGELGVAVESKFLGAGAIVPWAKAGVGAIATQSLANTSYGDRGLELLAQGLSPEEAGRRLTDEDDNAPHRQFGIVDAHGRSYTYTGKGCTQWAGGRAGLNYACQGNILVSEDTVNAMAQTFEFNPGLPLPERLLAALQAGQAAGGDSRGQQSAALLIVKERGGYGGFNDIAIRLHVEDHAHPIDELERLLKLHRVYFPPALDVSNFLPLSEWLVSEVQDRLSHLGYYKGESHGQYDEATQAALEHFCRNENLEERWRDGNQVDPLILEFLRDISR